MKNKNGIIVIISIALFLTAFLISWQVKTIKNSDTSVLQLQREDALREEVLKWRQNYNDKNEKLTNTEKKLQEYLNNISKTDKTIELLQKEIKQLNLLSGLTTVEGPGVIITMKDAQIFNPLYLAEDQIVHDIDVIQIVNELKAAGAEAISINGQRIIANTAIRCVGPSILINDIKIGAPFIIKAIGNIDYLYSGLNLSGGIVDTMRKYGILIDIEQSQNISVPKYEGTIKMIYSVEEEVK